MLKVRDLMSTDVISVTPETTVREAMELFAKEHISGAPVLRGSAVAGVVSAADLLAFAASLPGVPTEREAGEWEEDDDVEGADQAEWENAPASAFFTDFWADTGAETTGRIAAASSPEWDVLEEHEVSEVMTRKVRALSPDANVAKAAELMARNGIHRVLVMEGEELKGILTATDLIRAVAEGKLVKRTYIFRPGSDFDERGWPG